jgi:hypothetical protein
VADGDRDPELVGQGLQLALPQPHPHPVAAAAVRGDQQPRRGRIPRRTELVPPAADALDGEAGGVVGDAETDPPRVGGDVVDPVGHRLAELGDGEVVHPDRLGPPLRTQLTPAVPEVADQLLLLGVDRDRRLAGGLELLHRGVDVLELGVAVGVAGALAGLAVGLQAEAQAAQQAADQLLPRGEAPLGQGRGQVALAPADPPQRRLRVAADRGLHQLVQRLEKPGLGLGRRPAAASRSAHPGAECLGACPQVRQATADRAAGDPGRAGHRLDPAASRGPCLARREQAPSSFVQERGERIEAGLDGGEVNHRTRVDPPDGSSDSFPASALDAPHADRRPFFRFGYSGSGPKDSRRNNCSRFSVFGKVQIFWPGAVSNDPGAVSNDHR